MDKIHLMHEYKGDAYLFKMDLADMATLVDWTENVTPEILISAGGTHLEIYDGLSKFSNLQEFAAQAEDVAYSTGYRYGIPVDFVSSHQVLRPPVKRNPNLKYGTFLKVVYTKKTEAIYSRAYADIQKKTMRVLYHDPQPLDTYLVHEVKRSIRQGELVITEDASHVLGLEDGFYLGGRKI